MSLLLDDPPPETEPTATDTDADQLRNVTTAARLHFMWLGTQKSLTPAQKSRAADPFGAEGKFLAAGKKLLDTSHPAYRAVTAVRTRATAYWRGVSLPFPEPGVRLIRRDLVAEFDTRIEEFQEQLAHEVAELDHHYDELRQLARERLGDLFDAADYPDTLVGAFAIRHDYPSVEPPEYLRRLSPDLYERECERVRARFDEAVQLAEAAFTEELARLVDHITERLGGTDDGRPKVFRDSAVTNLTDFFERFRALRIGSGSDLDALVDRAREAIAGVGPRQLRNSETLRDHVAGQLASVRDSLGDLLVDRPRRDLLRRPRPGEPHAHSH